ncbi:receptor-type tyrosine-protein phosphatase epsilon-like [Antedon mediterranea]|uniref:receptor-type tyrosine-protein phosphatase epsilon-like n=1 Tax=Antedon mediterranea TaxID=105859 RepID=UPI003AF54376
MEIAGNWGENITVQTAPSEPSVESNPFSNETHLHMKWKTSTCDIPDYQLTYHYKLSGGIFQQGNTNETEVFFDGIELCIEYTFTVLASYLKVEGTSDTTAVMLGTDCESGSQGSRAPIGVIIGCLIPVLVILLLVLIVIKRRRSYKSAGGVSGACVSTSGHVSRQIIQEQDIGDSAYDEVKGAPGELRGVENFSKEQVHTDDEVESESEYQPDTEIDQEPVYGNTQLNNQEYKPIELSKLHDYVMKRQLSFESGFEKEFEDLGNKPLFPSTVAKSSVNKKKNRYANVIPYDNTRVVLDKIDNVPGSDYINASYLDGYTIPHEFIACQGPNVASVNDMWRMIWKEKSSVIVVVTNLVEGKRKKCEQYWPDLNNRQEYAGISVTNARETNYGHYVIRTFQVQKVGDEDSIYNVVYQYHFTEWPDKSVSNAVPQLIDFIQTFRKTQQKVSSSGPVIVHCSAGAGRTGTVIAIAAMLDMSKDQGKVDVFNFVRSMRQKRIQMVQTEEQYKFIYAVILEELFCGETVIPVTELQNEIQRQTQQTPSHFDYQLKTLNCLFPLPVDDLTSHARLPENVFKNRFDDVVPLNKARPILMSQSDRGTDYINASFCDVYKKRNAYIVTQAPLADPANTTDDFWRLVFDYKSDVIVQLNDMDRSCGAYIPKQIKQPMKFGKYIVTVKSAMKNDFMIERKISLEKENNVREFAHFEFRQWPNGKTVPKVDQFVRFITNIGEGVVSSNKPTIVHCLDGVCRSGLFCLVHSMIGKMRDDKVVDVFQTLKTLRSTCPTMVKTKVQYNFCYDAAKCYLQNYQEYVNV